VPSDAFSAPSVQLAGDGTLKDLSGDLLFDNSGTTGVFLNADRVASVHPFTLWRPRSAPRLRLLIEGRYADHWLSPFGRIRVWPIQRGFSSAISFRLSLPQDWRKPAKTRIGGVSVKVKPGNHVDIVCRSRKQGRLDIDFSSNDIVVQPDFRRFTIKLTRIRLIDVRQRANTSAQTHTSACASR
jgi:hypothetical protein